MTDPSTLNPSQRNALNSVDCEICFDDMTRALYATDASLYQITPAAVAFPRSLTQAAQVARAATEHGVPIVPRGAGTGLAGGAIGAGLVLDLARHNRRIEALDPERRTVRVGAGVVLDQLNSYLAPHGLCFGPDVATSSRATLGGMVANNSSGARTPLYGVTADHVEALQLLLADGRAVKVGPEHDGLADWGPRIAGLVAAHAAEIENRMPPGLRKRWPGYGLERWLREGPNLARLLCGSEGTLALVHTAKLQLSPLPARRGLGVIFFDDVAEAMQATVELLDLTPAAIEHVDRMLFDQTVGQFAFRRARDLLRLDEQPCEAFLLVEFHDQIDDKLAAVAARTLGRRTSIFTQPVEMACVWALRKAGLSLLTGRPGPAKPTTGIEDTAVRPEQLPAYVADLRGLLERHGLQASFYGHAAAGLLHVRPVLDLHDANDLATFRALADEVSALVRQYKGSIAAEHGVGLARAAYLSDHLGEALLGAMREIKALFDPDGLLNPGKVFPGEARIDSQLRQGSQSMPALPWTPRLAFAEKDGSFWGNLEQCNGCGACRKAEPTMCPTFLATGDELMSTRGRANIIRAVLEHRLARPGEELRNDALEAALSNCLACKACTSECPSNVNLALLKAELLHARQKQHGASLAERLLSRTDLLGRLGCVAPGAANAMLRRAPLRKLMERALGLSAQRPLPPFARQRFDRWFHARPAPPAGTRGDVLLWDDCFVRYHEPHIGHAAVAVLEAAGYRVRLLQGRACCGRPAFSLGQLDLAARYGRHNLALAAAGETPIVFLEPSCFSMFAQDYRELGLDGAARVAARCYLFEDFVDRLLHDVPGALTFAPRERRVAVHGHCHTKALGWGDATTRLLRRLPGCEAITLDSGCCGMAGAFGMWRDKQELSRQVAEPLLRMIADLPAGTELVAGGTSCRHQLEDLAGILPRHVAEVLVEGLAPAGTV